MYNTDTNNRRRTLLLAHLIVTVFTGIDLFLKRAHYKRKPIRRTVEIFKKKKTSNIIRTDIETNEKYLYEHIYVSRRTLTIMIFALQMSVWPRHVYEHTPRGRQPVALGIEKTYLNTKRVANRFALTRSKMFIRFYTV